MGQADDRLCIDLWRVINEGREMAEKGDYELWESQIPKRLKELKIPPDIASVKQARLAVMYYNKSRGLASSNHQQYMALYEQIEACYEKIRRWCKQEQ